MACCVVSSFVEAFQPNHRPPIAMRPRTIIAGRCQDGDSLSTIVSDILGISPHPDRAEFGFPSSETARVWKGACAAPNGQGGPSSRDCLQVILGNEVMQGDSCMGKLV